MSIFLGTCLSMCKIPPCALAQAPFHLCIPLQTQPMVVPYLTSNLVPIVFLPSEIHMDLESAWVYVILESFQSMGYCYQGYRQGEIAILVVYSTGIIRYNIVIAIVRDCKCGWIRLLPL